MGPKTAAKQKCMTIGNITFGAQRRSMWRIEHNSYSIAAINTGLMDRTLQMPNFGDWKVFCLLRMRIIYFPEYRRTLNFNTYSIGTMQSQQLYIMCVYATAYMFQRHDYITADEGGPDYLSSHAVTVYM